MTLPNPSLVKQVRSLGASEFSLKFIAKNAQKQHICYGIRHFMSMPTSVALIERILVCSCQAMWLYIFKYILLVTDKISVKHDFFMMFVFL